MGILNVTPDSFYDGGKFTHEKSILEQAEKIIQQGASFIDVGGYSTRPGASEVDAFDEKNRVLRAITSILKRFPDALISVDTFRAEIAQAAVESGAIMVNDISGGELDANMFTTIGQLNVPYVLMHMRGNPQTMTKQTQYDHLVKEITNYFHRKLQKLKAHGVKDVILDPGFGFAKTRQQNFQLLNSLADFKPLENLLMVGLSRKSMVWKTLDVNPEGALNGSTALHSIAVLKGADILRVHDVKEAVEVITLVTEMNRSSSAKIN